MPMLEIDGVKVEPNPKTFVELNLKSRRFLMKIRLADFVTIVIILSVFLSGCAAMQVASAKQQLDARINPLIGKGENEVIMSLGAPQSTERFGDFIIWHYYQSYGSRTTASIVPNPYITSGSGAAWEAYDKYDLYFRDGVLVKWSGYVQR